MLGHVRIGKFNVGQKLFAWTMIAAVTCITASGFVLMFRGFFSQDVQELCHLAHAASFVVIGVFLIIHMYLALLPMNRPALYAMFRDGTLPAEFVKHHHPIWYEKTERFKEMKSFALSHLCAFVSCTSQLCAACRTRVHEYFAKIRKAVKNDDACLNESELFDNIIS